MLDFIWIRVRFPPTQTRDSYIRLCTLAMVPRRSRDSSLHQITVHNNNNLQTPVIYHLSGHLHLPKPEWQIWYIC